MADRHATMQDDLPRTPSRRRAARSEPPTWIEACADDADLRQQRRSPAPARPTPGRRCRRPAASHRGDAGASPRSAERPGSSHRPVQAAAADRRRRHGRRSAMAEQTAAGASARSRSRSSSRAWTRGRCIARFEAERQALALMDHPNIARVLDAGATEHGRPYFVMELVKGVPITEYCDEQPPDARASGWSCSCRSARRCSTPIRRGSSTATSSRRTCWSRCYDGKPVPKVIDFGVAKATEPAADRADAVHRVRRHGRHAGVHEPGAGGAERSWTSTRAATSTRWACCSTSC